MMRFRGDSLSEFYGVDSEIGQLRTVLVHRPGAELRRVTPQQKCGLLLPALPWAERAQAEHDAFTAALRSRGVEVLYLTELLQDALEYAPGRQQAIVTAISDPRLGEELRGQLREYLEGLRPEELGHTVLAVLPDPTTAECLDTRCTMVAADTVLMRPSVAYSLVARTITQRGDGLRLSHPRPFLEAAAQAMGLDRLRVIETGLGPARVGPARAGSLGGPAGQWDDAGNILALGPGTVVSYERNTLTNERLEAIGIEVIRVPGGELVGSRGGPRSVCCPVSRDPAKLPEASAERLPAVSVPAPRRATS